MVTVDEVWNTCGLEERRTSKAESLPEYAAEVLGLLPEIVPWATVGYVMLDQLLSMLWYGGELKKLTDIQEILGKRGGGGICKRNSSLKHFMANTSSANVPN